MKAQVLMKILAALIARMTIKMQDVEAVLYCFPIFIRLVISL